MSFGRKHQKTSQDAIKILDVFVVALSCPIQTVICGRDQGQGHRALLMLWWSLTLLFIFKIYLRYIFFIFKSIHDKPEPKQQMSVWKKNYTCVFFKLLCVTCESGRHISSQSLWALCLRAAQHWGITGVENDVFPLVMEFKLSWSQTERHCGDKMITSHSLELWGMMFVHHSLCVSDENGAKEEMEETEEKVEVMENKEVGSGLERKG